MNYTFNVTEIRCNGIGSPAWPASDKVTQLSLNLITRVKDQLGLDVIFRKLSEMDPSGDYYAGNRFTDPIIVNHRLVSALGDWAWARTGCQPDCDNLIQSVLENITEEDAIVLVIDAYRDCASADYWYLFEKEW